MDSFFRLFERQAERNPEKPALIFKGKVFTYGEIYDLVKSFSAGLLELGIGPQTHLGLLLGNSPEMVALLLSASALNLTLVPLPPSIPPKVGKRIFERTDVSAVILPSYLRKDWEGNFSFFELEKVPRRDSVSFPDPEPERPYIITTTSGSTGEPKPIILTEKTKLIRAFEGGKEIYELTEEDVFLISTPLYHSLAQRFTLLPLSLGATVVLLERFYLKGWFESVERYRVSFSVLVSTQLENILRTLREERFKEYDLSSLKKAFSSSAPLSEWARREALKWAEVYGWRIFENYGTSEVGIATNIEITKETSKWRSVGRPLPYVEVKVVGPKGGKLKPFQVGEIAVKTKTAFGGYYGMEETTKRSFDEEGFFLTGDLGYLDQEGYLYFVGRKKEVIITGGINVYPQDVERVILEHPSVKECAVFGVEAPRFGEVVCALVVPYNPQNFELKELKRFCRQNLATYQQPLVWKVVKEIPKSHLGKVVRRELKKLISKREVEEALRKFSALL